MNILLVDLNTNSTTTRPLSDPLLSGWPLTAQLIAELVDPRADPRGSGNALAFAAGPFAGRRVSTGGRLSVGGLSPRVSGLKPTGSMFDVPTAELDQIWDQA